MKFELNKDELDQFVKWKKSLPKVPVDVWGEEYQYIFSFYPTGLGVVKTVQRTYGEKIDLTDYSNW